CASGSVGRCTRTVMSPYVSGAELAVMCAERNSRSYPRNAEISWNDGSSDSPSVGSEASTYYAGWAGPSAGPLSACCWGPGLPVVPGDPGVPAPGVGPCGSWIDDVTVGSEGTDQKASLVKNCPGSSTWYLASSSRCTLNRSSGYR